MSKHTKTMYCVYHGKCRRSENCGGGDYCPVMKFNKEFSALEESIDGEALLKMDETITGLFDDRELIARTG